MNIAFFDFDGTITHSDSFVRFIIFAVGRLRFFAGMIVLSPIIAMYTLNIFPNWKAKEMVLRYFFSGWQKSLFDKIAKDYSKNHLVSIVRPEALERIKWHKRNNDTVVVVSASFKAWLESWCNEQGLDLICSELEARDFRLTGRIKNKNCFGDEKVRLIQDKYNLSEYGKIYAYGDSGGDVAMLNIADEKYYRWKKV